MAKGKGKKRGTPSARAQERARIQEKYKDATLSQLDRAYSNGKITLPELRKYYTDARAIAMKRIKRISESDVPFVDGKPDFPKVKEISDSELINAVADLNRFNQGKWDTMGATIKKRREVRDKAIKTAEQTLGISIDKSEWSRLVRFMEWFKNAAISKKYDSDDEETVAMWEQVLESDATTGAEFEAIASEF